jgi:hypothetical protein
LHGFYLGLFGHQFRIVLKGFLNERTKLYDLLNKTLVPCQDGPWQPKQKDAEQQPLPGKSFSSLHIILQFQTSPSLLLKKWGDRESQARKSFLPQQEDWRVIS